MKVPYAKYIAVPVWDGQQWQVRVEDYDELHRGATTAARLAHVGPKTSALLAAQLGCHPIHIRPSVEPELPEEIDHTLQVAETDVAHAVAAMRRLRMSGHDIAALLTERIMRNAIEPPLLIPNNEIAEYALNRRRNVLAVEWLDRDNLVTCCRACIDNDPRPWQHQPHAASAAIYNGPAQCDICGQGITATSAARETGQ